MALKRLLGLPIPLHRLALVFAFLTPYNNVRFEKWQHYL